MTRKKKNSGGGVYAEPGPGAQGPVNFHPKPPKKPGGTYAENEKGEKRAAVDRRAEERRHGRPKPRVSKTIPNKDDIQSIYHFPAKNIPAPAPAVTQQQADPYAAFSQLINGLVPQQPAIDLQTYLKPYDELDKAIEAQALTNAGAIIQNDTHLRDMLAGTNKQEITNRVNTRSQGLENVAGTTQAVTGIYDQGQQNLQKFGVQGGIAPEMQDDRAAALADLAQQSQTVRDQAAESKESQINENAARTYEAASQATGAQQALAANKTKALLQSAQGRAGATGDYNAAVTGQRQQDFQNKLSAAQGLAPLFDQYNQQQAQVQQQQVQQEVNSSIHPGANPNQATYFNSLTSRYDSPDQALSDLEAADQSGDLKELGIGPGQKQQLADWITRWYGASQAGTQADPMAQLEYLRRAFGQQ